uniref:Uncharacterized protein n=1 Tax=Chromera velia CCMP2878 TaxID=1169474 RepID=A0A0G4IE22_9ALVE|eukprot:Cvel_13613.t1-p1 / transcript=Cvel_13613.t1 / gene=Cvel_13613 / organism=Chromera_velia_CCMP2878 / gene_product=hypothetical protein / transcript_product=hypothetical protein / location=Cvel_scaffold937:35672-37002(-) / protein_length=164 / sequence_SO=supercontig / SO=protein_coding / is_pseudo=false
MRRLLHHLEPRKQQHCTDPLSDLQAGIPPGTAAPHFSSERHCGDFPEDTRIESRNQRSTVRRRRAGPAFTESSAASPTPSPPTTAAACAEHESAKGKGTLGGRTSAAPPLLLSHTPTGRRTCVENARGRDWEYVKRPTPQSAVPSRPAGGAEGGDTTAAGRRVG